MSTKDFLERLEADPPIRIPGTAVVHVGVANRHPRHPLHHLKHNRVLHERVFLVSVHGHRRARRCADEDRVHLVPVGAGIQRLILRLGLTEKPNVPAALRLRQRSIRCPISIPRT